MSGPGAIVVTHEAADFDAFAAAVAAQRLHAGAAIVLSRNLAPDLRAFLTVHRGRFPTLDPEEVDPRAVARVIVVDVRRASRVAGLGGVAARIAAGDPDLEVEVWDHHAASDDDLRADEAHVEAVGSVTTLLVEALRARGLPIDRAEATLFALGIHADTGSLTYAGTSARDAEALAALLRAGAELPVIGRYLTPALSAEQRHALADALAGLDRLEVGGLAVGVARVKLARGTSGLDVVTSYALGAAGVAALFGIFTMTGSAGASKSIVVGRARPGALDLRPVMAALGGGGHAGAGSASLQGQEPEAIQATIAAALAEAPSTAPRVASRMSAPARVAAPMTSIAALDSLLRAWGCSFAPIVDEGRLVGAIGRREIDRALRAGRGDLPAASAMHHVVVTIGPDATLDEALMRMSGGKVGHLPVVADGAVVGVLSRSDLVRALYHLDP